MQNNIQPSDNLLQAFPSRDLKLSPLKGDGGIWRTLFLVIAMIAITLFCAYQLPNIAYDYKIGQNAIPVDANIKGSCKTSLLVITNCSVDLSYQGHSVSRNFTFLGFNGGDIEVMPLADGNDRSKLTVDIAVDNVMLRFVTTLILIALFVFCIFIFIKRQILAGKVKKALLSVGSKPLKLIAIPAKIISTNKMIIANYKFDLDGKSESIAYSGNKKTTPIIFELNGSEYVLAVCDPQQNIPFILDLPLKRIQATPDEVQHFQDALREEGLI